MTVTLKNSYAPWSAETTSQFPIFEKKFADEHPATMGRPGVLIMGTGPWQIDSFDPTTGVELSANPHWWGGTVPVRQISVKFFASETSEALAFRAGEIDVAFPNDGATFAAASGAKVTSWLNNQTGYLSPCRARRRTGWPGGTRLARTARLGRAAMTPEPQKRERFLLLSREGDARTEPDQLCNQGKSGSPGARDRDSGSLTTPSRVQRSTIFVMAPTAAVTGSGRTGGHGRGRPRSAHSRMGRAGGAARHLVGAAQGRPCQSRFTRPTRVLKL